MQLPIGTTHYTKALHFENVRKLLSLGCAASPLGATNSKRGVAATSIATGPGQTQASGATADEPDPGALAADES